MWIENIILGIAQGIGEWLPISSEGLIALIKINFFSGENLFSIIKLALFLHLGTFCAAFVYFRKDVLSLLKALFFYKTAEEKNKKLLTFLIISTTISGLLGFGLITLLSQIENQIRLSGKIITAGVGILLLLTALLQIRTKKTGSRNISDLKKTDAIILGFIQGFAVLPGLSRSGTTVAALLLKKFDKTVALKLSFLMSLPIVLIGNIFLGIKYFEFSFEALAGFLFSFIFGLLTIHLLFKIAEKVNFGYFILFFGILTIISVFI
ncbi:MAG: undecaprenyl-diphosphate phosphatase [Candidatus Omnitrophica bacterium]|nr:undecaprenyl-diphosphate phosphatase [Candidatus Omnitrophota bacterium]